jgi:hypothetical protein
MQTAYINADRYAIVLDAVRTNLTQQEADQATGDRRNVPRRSGALPSIIRLRFVPRTPIARRAPEICGQTGDLWSEICGPDGTGTLLGAVNRPPLFRSSIEGCDPQKMVTDRRQRELTFDPVADSRFPK